MASGPGLRGLPLALIAGGGVLIYSGVQNVTLAQVLGAAAKGTAPPIGPGQTVNTPQTAQSGTAAQQLSLSTPGGGPPAQNRALGRLMAGGYGWAAGDNWAALDHGWGVLESGWSNVAQNGTFPDGAYGIPQAHPGNKMPQAAWPKSAGGSSSAVAQIAWGLRYIRDTYGSPAQVPGWLGGSSYSGY